MTTTLITGANKGLGYETARQLIAAGHIVYIGARDPERGRQAAERLGARFVQLDVTSRRLRRGGGQGDRGRRRAGRPGQQRRHRRPHPRQRGSSARRTRPPGTWPALFDTNVFGLVRMLHAFLPLLQRSAGAGRGQPQQRPVQDGRPGQPRRARALLPGRRLPGLQDRGQHADGAVRQGVPRHQDQRRRPGYTATDLNGGTGTQTVEQGAAIIVRMARLGPNEPAGRHFAAAGSVAW